MAVADGDSAVRLQQQHRHRLADDVAPPDDDCFFAVKVNPRAADHLHCALGCARNHARLSAHHPPRVEQVEAVHILFRRDNRQRCRLIEVFRQGQLHQNAVDGVVRIQTGYQLLQFVLRCRFGQIDGHGVNADLITPDALVAHINLAGWVCADENHRQSRRDALFAQARHPLCNCPAKLR